MRYVKRVIRKSCSTIEVTLGNAFREFYLEKETKGLASVSLHSYVSCFTVFKRFNGFTDQTSSSEVSVDNIYNWIHDLKQHNARTATINSYMAYIRSFLYWCMDEERQYITPFKVPTVKGQEEKLKLYTEDELIRLLEKPHKNDSFATWRTWAVVNWALATGNRAASIFAVKIRDIDFKSKEIFLTHTKNRISQNIPLSPALELVLREYIKMWRRYADSEAWLFPNVGEEQLTYSAHMQRYKRYCQERGVQRHNMHGLRHNFAKGWIVNGGNAFALQRVLGHSNMNMTKRYVRLFTEDIKEDYSAYSALDTIKKAKSRTQLVKRT